MTTSEKNKTELQARRSIAGSVFSIGIGLYGHYRERSRATSLDHCSSGSFTACFSKRVSLQVGFFIFLQTVASLSPVLFCFQSVRTEYKLSRLSKRTVRLTFRVNFRDVGMFSKHFHHVINLLLTRIFLHSYRMNIDACFFSKNLPALRPCSLDC